MIKHTIVAVSLSLTSAVVLGQRTVQYEAPISAGQGAGQK